MEVTHTAILGAGVIGASWAALFLASGRSVSVYDPSPGAEAAARAYIELAWPTLTQLGLTTRGDPGRITFHDNAKIAMESADFVQENVPEWLPVKHALFAEISPALSPHAIVASSASGLTLSQMQAGCPDPARLILGHPFNPPHLIPLVEVMGNDRTAPGVIETAEAFYTDIGKTTIRVQREVPGHVANRLQAAVWREAIHLVQTGVATVADVDRAMSAGPGLRWAAMGPTTLFSLGAGPGGMQAFCDHFRDTFNGWWDDLGQPYLDDATIKMIVEGAAEAAEGEDHAALCARRDAMIAAMQGALRDLRAAKP
ncbi:3-hydroxyacyl-CoA dehydrogenase [Roseovarius sp. LXJ103]|uniref:3-hydroxyacyl-CoA dehydrogenase NAD-binding domain-containing protein n=1 Tax=Roseovarius carneus TaxID=2853164 RepID=UPI000D60C460|nr:3-hydroxyacyl-CoA dehydrogenase NAD-binding domain-containing protein [Roseovarius carneus]MBZ8119525.1 3-hydroxyacyl-CoA dehydrogenase [Roseovarius carneus]PWE34849.1 3-hydroxyacyl-CoA dehydrogenase [Pelagicola sp. LXJ1103]